MTPEEAKSIVRSTAKAFSEPVENGGASSSEVLFKYICFDWLLIREVLDPLRNALCELNDRDFWAFREERARIVDGCIKLLPPLLMADGKAGIEEEGWRDNSINLVKDVVTLAGIGLDR